MSASTLFFLLIVVACPLMMMFMMRGGHGHGGMAGHDGKGEQAEPGETSTGELRRQRAELDRQIEARERFEQPESERELTSWGAGRR